MSAFLIPRAHINFMLTYVRRHWLFLPHPHEPNCSVDLRSQPIADLCGRELIRENMRSLAYLDSVERNRDLQELVLATYHFTIDDRALTSTPGALGVIKATHCYDEQSCDVPGYPDSWSADVMRRIREVACYFLPGYDDAPWLFDRSPFS